MNALQAKGSFKRGRTLKVKTELQNRLIWLVFLALVIPTLVFGTAFYSLMYYVLHGSPTSSPYEVMSKLLLFIVVVFPLSLAGFLYWAFYTTDKMVGPVQRMIRELDERLQGKKAGPIQLRPNDHLIPLAEKINEVLRDWDELRQGRLAGLANNPPLQPNFGDLATPSVAAQAGLTKPS